VLSWENRENSEVAGGLSGFDVETPAYRHSSRASKLGKCTSLRTMLLFPNCQRTNNSGLCHPPSTSLCFSPTPIWIRFGAYVCAQSRMNPGYLACCILFRTSSNPFSPMKKMTIISEKRTRQRNRETKDCPTAPYIKYC
jgi:hypothetical protein